MMKYNSKMLCKLQSIFFCDRPKRNRQTHCFFNFGLCEEGLNSISTFRSPRPPKALLSWGNPPNPTALKEPTPAKCSEDLNTALRISYIKTGYGAHCPMMIKPSITRSAKSLSQPTPLCSEIMSRATAQIGSALSDSTSKKPTAREPQLRANSATGM